MTKASSAEPASADCHCETGVVGRGDPAGLLRRVVSPDDKTSSFILWPWVAGCFLLLVIAWAVMFAAARSAKIESVPLATQGGKTR